MAEFFQTINTFLKYYLITGFALYSLFFFIVRYFSKQKEAFDKFDATACKIIVYTGIIFGIVWIAQQFTQYITLENEFEQAHFLERLTGTYWFSFWSSFIFVVILTQLVRIKLLQRSVIYRIVMSLILIITYEKMFIWITAFHRDYLPSSWSSNLPVGTILLDFILKIVLFVALVSVIHFSFQKITTKT